MRDSRNPPRENLGEGSHGRRQWRKRGFLEEPKEDCGKSLYGFGSHGQIIFCKDPSGYRLIEQ